MSSSLFINLNTGNVKAVIILLMGKYSNDLAFLNYLDEISIRNGGEKKNQLQISASSVSSING